MQDFALISKAGALMSISGGFVLQAKLFLRENASWWFLTKDALWSAQGDPLCAPWPGLQHPGLHHRQFSISTLWMLGPWIFWAAKKCVTTEKETDWLFFPLLYYFSASHVTPGNSDEGFFHIIYMFKYKEKRDFLQVPRTSLLQSSVWILGLDLGLAGVTELSRVGTQEACFSHLSRGGICILLDRFIWNV